MGLGGELTPHQFESHPAMVELVGTIAAYNMVSRFLVALGVGPEGE